MMNTKSSIQNPGVLEKGENNKMDPSNSLVIETHNLSKAYKGVQALKDLNLTVQAALDLRLPGTQRCRQDHDHENPAWTDQADQRGSERSSVTTS